LANIYLEEFMLRSILFRGALAAAFGMAAGSSAFGASQQKQDSGQDKHVDIQSSVGDLHMGTDADARKVGLPLYPGARVRHDEDDSNAANLSLFTQYFGVKLVVAKYDSDDVPAKVVDFYRDKLKKYGKVIECHTREHGGTHADVNDDEDSDSEHTKPVKCEGDNTGPVTELKVGTEANQRVVAIEPKNGGKSSTFALVYVHARGKQGDI
jgi:hypothetical protein